jgi:hypothetical protein
MPAKTIRKTIRLMISGFSMSGVHCRAFEWAEMIGTAYSDP